VTSAFIPDVQSDLKPGYVGGGLLELLVTRKVGFWNGLRATANPWEPSLEEKVTEQDEG